MTSPQICRLALTALDVPLRVCKALDDFRANAFTLRELCAVGTPQVVRKMHQSIEFVDQFEHYLPLFRDVEPMIASQAGREIVTTVNRLDIAGRTSIAREEVVSISTECWLPAADRAGLMSRIFEGELIIIIAPGSHARWILGTTLLLRHSRHSVQTITRDILH